MDIHFSPRERQELLERVARLIVDEIRESAGGSLDDWVILPLKTAEQFTGYSSKQLKRILPVTSIGSGKDGVTVGNLKKAIAAGTVDPKVLGTKKLQGGSV